MTDAQVYAAQIVPQVHGFIRGALMFGGTPDAIHSALSQTFPRLRPAQIDTLLQGVLLSYGKTLN